MKKVYLDNAATSWPKPSEVSEAMANFLLEVGCNPGRGGYECAREAGHMVFDCRLQLAELFNAPSPEQIIFTANVTQALNIALKGLLRPGDHVLTSSLEHNAVIRPLRGMEKNPGIELDFLPFCASRGINPDDIRKMLKSNTRVIVLTHSSNVSGVILPLEEVGEMVKENDDLYFVIDAAQTAGNYQLDFSALNADVLAFTGHKGLLGPPGTGGMVVTPAVAREMAPLLEGGTGSISNEEYQPDFLPDKFESGTLNTPGLAGLLAGLDYLKRTSREQVKKRLAELTTEFLAGVQDIQGVKIHGPKGVANRTALISLTVDGWDLGELAEQLDREYNILTRSGLHCSPVAHRALGTFPFGTLRFSLGPFNTREEIVYTVDSLQQCLKR